VSIAQPFVQHENCLVHAGDSAIISEKMDYLKRLIEAFEHFNADAAFLVLEIKNPKQYGIVEGKEIEPLILFLIP
jgi:dTDP-glucose pyrophosphorylase